MANNAIYYSNATCEYSKQIRTLLNVISTDAESLGGVPAEKYELKERTKNTITGVVMQFGYSALEDSPPILWSETRTLIKSSNRILKTPFTNNLTEGERYTLYVEVLSMDNFIDNERGLFVSVIGDPEKIIRLSQGVCKNTFIAPTNAKRLDFYIDSGENDNATAVLKNIMVLEGDWTNNEESPYLWQRLKLTHLDGSNTYTTATSMPKPEELDTSQFATAVQGALAESALQRSEYTASDVFTKVKSQDGAGSGLDADKLDGKHASEFATAAQGTKADNALPNSMFTSENVLHKLKPVDGHGSELDADTLDGLHGTSYVKTAGTKQYLGTEPIVKGTGGYTSKMTIEDSNARELGEISFTGTSNLNIIAKQGVMNLDTPNKSGGLRHNTYRVPTVSWGSTVPSDQPPGHIFIKI